MVSQGFSTPLLCHTTKRYFWLILIILFWQLYYYLLVGNVDTMRNTIPHRDARQDNGDGQVVKRGDVIGGDDATWCVSVLHRLLSNHKPQDGVQHPQHNTVTKHIYIWQSTMVLYTMYYNAPITQYRKISYLITLSLLSYECVMWEDTCSQEQLQTDENAEEEEDDAKWCVQHQEEQGRSTRKPVKITINCCILCCNK